LSAGPATNSVTMGVVASMFGKKSLFLYLGSISVLSVIFGYIFDTFFANLEFFSIIGHNEHLSIIDTISTIILFGLMIFYTIRKKNVSM
jgi:type III secretory pathway component EscU